MPAQKQKELEIRRIEVERLLLDDENPRLSGISDGRTQDDLVRVLWDEMAVSEVALSIAENGYFEEEPLFVIPKLPKEQDASKQRYIVVEGNRRLAAVKLLRDPELRRAMKATDLPEISSKARAELDRLPVSVYPDKRSLWAFFGFRHVNGPKEWDSFSKAAYVAQVRRNYGIPLDVISRKIGDQHDTVVRIYRGYVLLEQAEEMTEFKREDRIANRFFFSHLYTAADQNEFQKFLGIDSKGSLKDKPVPKEQPTYGKVSKDDRHNSATKYWQFLKDSWIGVAPLLKHSATIVVRLGAIAMSEREMTDQLFATIKAAFPNSKMLTRPTRSNIVRRQAINFLPTSKGCRYEMDFVFTI